MKNLKTFLEENLTELKTKNLLRSFKDKVHEDYKLCFSSNDYLGLAKNRLSEIDLRDTHSLGSTGSRLTTGTHKAHLELEEYIAKWKGTEAALLFSSGYLANLGALASLLNQRDVVFSDELNHSCILDGVRLSKAKRFNYQHNDMEQLEALIKKHRSDYQKAFIVTDSIFSMDGDRAKLKEINSLAKQYELTIYIDEAHATGVLGSSGAGLFEELKDQQQLKAADIEIQMGTFSKATGLEGGYIAGSQDLIDYLLSRARTFMFSTATSPLIIKQILNNLKIINSSRGNLLREKLFSNINYFKTKLLEKKLSFINEDTAIFAVFMGSLEENLRAADKLKSHGILVPAIRPPTVKQPRLRICINAAHSKDDMDQLLALI